METDTDATPSDPGSRAHRDLLRHTLATLAYRTGKPLRDAPDGFGAFQGPNRVRTPLGIVAHMADLIEWGHRMAARGAERGRSQKRGGWDEEVARFYRALQAFDDFLAGEQPLRRSAQRIFQGPIADALTHCGQLNLLRRLAGAPAKGENYYVADIETGRVGADQAAPRLEF